MSDLTTIVINFQTPDLIKTAVESFRKFYPEEELLIIDNGSKDELSKDVILALSKKNSKTKTLFLSNNIFHGPAMNLAIKTTFTKYLFFLDSDTKTIYGGFLEKMMSELSVSEKNYAIGKRDSVNKRGFITKTNGIPIVRSSYMMLKRESYFLFPEFCHQGLPSYENFKEANQNGFSLLSFPIENYIEHAGRGTASKFGYKLGLKSKIDFALNKLGI
ncbi:MAG: glycosyltransferase family 2 protein [Bacteroidetes bacterium]|nr:glycosyltransferase family 2 protein [Bacteroidota bacterium]